MLLRLLDEEYTGRPFSAAGKMWFGYAPKAIASTASGWQRLMRILGLSGMVWPQHQKKPPPAHAVYPYLPRGLGIVRLNQVWST
ncbi:hypothetical protein [Methylovulum psychrotolerans]|uniref:hypothetical protein n=1 Tax=Methylovulum psychrotolerans TaxID=1704499 RepID=UPI000CDED55A